MSWLKYFVRNTLNTSLHIKNVQGADIKKCQSKITKLQKEHENLIQALKDDISTAVVKGDLERIFQVEGLETKYAKYPAIAQRYKSEINCLIQTINTDRKHAETREKIRALIEEIRLIQIKGKEDLP